MNQYITLNVKFINSQLNKLKLGIKMVLKKLSKFHQMLQVILMIKVIFLINCY